MLRKAGICSSLLVAGYVGKVCYNNPIAIESSMRWNYHKFYNKSLSLASRLSSVNPVVDKLINDDTIQKLKTNTSFQEDFYIEFRKKVHTCHPFNPSYRYSEKGYDGEFLTGGISELYCVLEDKLNTIKNYKEVFDALPTEFKNSSRGKDLGIKISSITETLTYKLKNRKEKENENKQKRQARASIESLTRNVF